MTSVEVPGAGHRALADGAARQLANATKSKAQLETITPRWLVRMLPWTPIEAGVYRLNRVVRPGGQPAAGRIRAADNLRQQ